MSIRRLLKEVTGVPTALNLWVEVFSNIIANLVEESINGDDFTEKKIKYTIDGQQIESYFEQEGYNVSSEYILKSTLDFLGYSDVDDLLKDSRFKSFPLYDIKMKLDINLIPDELFEYEFSDKSMYETVSGSHSTKTSQKQIGVIKKCPSCEKNSVFINQKFTFTVFLPFSSKKNFDKKKIKSITKPTVNHELLHAYEGYQKALKNKSIFYGQETFLNMMRTTLPDEIQIVAKDFMHFIYLHLYFEINARVSQLYQELIEKNVTTKEDFIKEIQKSEVWSDLKSLMNFKAEDYLKSIENEFGEESVKNFIENWDIFLQHLNQIVKLHGKYEGKYMSKVPEAAKENPVVFFKFFENRFHEKAELFKKKIYKLYDVVVNRTLVTENHQRVNCPSCGHNWELEPDDKNPYLCHMCAYDSKKKSYDPEKVNKFWDEELQEKWSKKYKKSINCSNPRGFSQKAHCAARRKRKAGQKTKSKSPFK